MLSKPEDFQASLGRKLIPALPVWLPQLEQKLTWNAEARDVLAVSRGAISGRWLCPRMKRSSLSYDLQLLRFQCLLSQLAVGTLGTVKGKDASPTS